MTTKQAVEFHAKEAAKMKYRGYSIEQERDGTYSLYSLTNSMYDCHNGFKTIADAKAAADKRAA